MASTIHLEVHGTIARPIEEVRSQFGDMVYHARGHVHKALKYKIIEILPESIRYGQEVTILGLKQKDEILTQRMSDGRVISEVLAGSNQGLRIVFSFESISTELCTVVANFTVPVRGLKRLFAPLLKFAIRKKAEHAISEDRHDLESGAYAAYFKTI